MHLDQTNIIKTLGIENLPDDRKLALLEKMTALLEKRLMARMLTQLPENDMDKFAEVLESNETQETQAFISQHFPKFPDWLTEELETLKGELKEFANQHS